MEAEKKRRGLVILIPVLLLLLIAFSLSKEEQPEEPALAPPQPIAELEPPREVEPVLPEPEPEPVVASAVIADPAPQPAPKPARKATPAVEPPAEEPLPEEPVEEAPAEEAPPPDEPAPEDPVIQQDEPPREPATGSVMVLFEDDLPFVRPVSVQVAFDGGVVAVKKLAEGEGEDPVTVHTGDLQVGTHTIDLEIQLYGDGGGFFSYVDGYQFTAKQHAVFELKEGQHARVFIKTTERSATNTWEERVGLRIEIQSSGPSI
jgi:hypothetical protein